MAGLYIPFNDAEKKLLSDRYLDLQFEQDIDDFVCVRCNRLAIVHFFTNCGHLLCLNCKRIIDNGGFTCPQCNTLITNANKQREDFERQMMILRTKCPNAKYGCHHTINLAQIPEHVGVCKFIREQALPVLSTESNTMFSVLEKINEHNGQIVELKIGFTKMNEHIIALEKFKKDLKMELRGLRSDINIETRERQEISNQLKKIAAEIQLGIETNLKKLIADEFRALKEEIYLVNSTIKKEMANINDKVKELEQQEAQLKEQLSIIQFPNTKDPIEEFLKHKSSVQHLVDSFLFGSAEEQMAFESLCLKWTITHNDILIPTVVGHEHMSDIFPVYRFQINSQLRLTIYSGGEINIHLCFKDEEREGQEVDIKPLPIVNFIIKDLSGHNKHLISYRFHSFNSSLQYNQFGYGSGPISKSQCNALVSPVDASLEVLVLVEPLTIIKNPLSMDGTIMDTIEHYSRKLKIKKEGLKCGHWSSPFLTHTGGFRVAVEMRLNESIGENKRGLLAWIMFLPGEFDSQLEVEFEHETSVMLINQLDAYNNITVKKQATEAYSYYIESASSDVISSGGFIVNDSLTYHVTIRPIK